MKLINLSNHSSSKWSDAQKEGFEEIIDLPFPNIPATATTAEVAEIVATFAEKLGQLNLEGYSNIMLQGEFTFCFILQRVLHDKNWTFYFPTTKRKTIETTSADGTTTKTAIFEFVNWRTL